MVEYEDYICIDILYDRIILKFYHMGMNTYQKISEGREGIFIASDLDIFLINKVALFLVDILIMGMGVDGGKGWDGVVTVRRKMISHWKKIKLLVCFFAAEQEPAKYEPFRIVQNLFLINKKKKIIYEINENIIECLTNAKKVRFESQSKLQAFKGVLKVGLAQYKS